MWRNGMNTLSVLLAMCESKSRVGYPHSGPVIQKFDFCIVIRNKPLKNSRTAGEMGRHDTQETYQGYFVVFRYPAIWIFMLRWYMSLNLKCYCLTESDIDWGLFKIYTWQFYTRITLQKYKHTEYWTI